MAAVCGGGCCVAALGPKPKWVSDRLDALAFQRVEDNPPPPPFWIFYT